MWAGVARLRLAATTRSGEGTFAFEGEAEAEVESGGVVGAGARRCRAAGVPVSGTGPDVVPGGVREFASHLSVLVRGPIGSGFDGGSG